MVSFIPVAQFTFNFIDCSINPLEVPDDDDSMVAEEEGPLVSSFCSGYDANSSTTFSSRANTPHSELLENSGTENVLKAYI